MLRPNMHHPNMRQVLTLERRAAPVVSCMTYADVGAYQEQDGQTGRPLLCMMYIRACAYGA